MLFTITILTVSTRIASSNATDLSRDIPFSGGLNRSITLNSPTTSTLTLQDDDNRFDNGSYAPGEKQQIVHADTPIGFGSTASVLEKGLQLTFTHGALIRDDAGNEFVFMFPREFMEDSDTGGPVIGDRHSVLVVPLPGSGTPKFPEFDPTRSFRFIRSYTVNDEVRFLELEEPSAPPPPPDPEPSDGSPCFSAGTMIMTASGRRTVERLRPGDLILTRDNGVQPVLWSGHRILGRADLDLAPNQRPIRIKRGALGRGQPERDLIVSPQHRILLCSPIVQRMFGQPEVLAPARLLVGVPGIEVIRASDGIAYWHLLFRRHEIIISEGAWTESLLPGPMALRAFGGAARAEIRALVAPEAVAPARLLPPGRSVRALVERCRRNPRRQLVENDPRPPLPADMLAAAAE